MLLSQYLLNKGVFDINIISENKKYFDYFYPEFEAIVDGNRSILYNVVAENLVNANRIKRLYLASKTKPQGGNGYQDFSTIFHVLGKIKLWEAIELNLNTQTLNEKFKNELEKEISFFDF